MRFSRALSLQNIGMFAALFLMLSGRLSAQTLPDASASEPVAPVPELTRYALFSYETEKFVRHLGAGDYLLVISGPMDTFMLGKVRDAIRSVPKARISLDLSGVTALFDLHKEALNDCENLISVVIPDGLVRIRWECFLGCDNLAAITATEANEQFSSSLGILYNKAGTELVVCPRAWQGAVEIPLAVTAVREGAFANCPNMTDFTLQTRTETYLEDGRTHERTIENDVFSVQDGILYSKDKETLVLFPAGKSGRVTIPATVRTIAPHAFAYCARVTAVEIPVGVRSIGMLAFGYCSSLQSVTIPESVTTIGKQAFLWCTSLGDVEIPADVSFLGSRSFFKSSVTSVRFADTDGWTYGKKILADLTNPHENAEKFTHPGKYWFLDLYKRADD